MFWTITCDIAILKVFLYSSSTGVLLLLCIYLFLNVQEQIRCRQPKYQEPKQARPLMSIPHPFNSSSVVAPPILRPGMLPPPSSGPMPVPMNIIRPGMGPPMVDGRPLFQPPPVGQIPPPV